MKDKLELRAERDEVRRRKVEIESIIEDLTGQLDGHLAVELRLSVELTRIQRQLRDQGRGLEDQNGRH